MNPIEITRFSAAKTNWEGLTQKYLLLYIKPESSQQAFGYDVFFDALEEEEDMPSIVSCVFGGFKEKAIYLLFQRKEEGFNEENRVKQHLRAYLGHVCEDNNFDAAFEIQVIHSEDEYRNLDPNIIPAVGSVYRIRQLFLNAVTWKEPFHNFTGRCLLLDSMPSPKEKDYRLAKTLEFRVRKDNTLLFRVVTFSTIYSKAQAFYHKEYLRDQFQMDAHFMKRCKKLYQPNEKGQMFDRFVERKPIWNNKKEQMPFMPFFSKPSKLHYFYQLISRAKHLAEGIIPFDMETIFYENIQPYNRKPEHTAVLAYKKGNPSLQEKLQQWAKQLTLEICFARDFEINTESQFLSSEDVQKIYQMLIPYFANVTFVQRNSYPFSSWDGQTKAGWIIFKEDKEFYRNNPQDDPYLDKENVEGVSVRLTWKTMKKIILPEKKEENLAKDIIAMEIRELREVTDIRQHKSWFYQQVDENSFALSHDLYLCTRNPNPGRKSYADEDEYFCVLHPDATLSFQHQNDANIIPLNLQVKLVHLLGKMDTEEAEPNRPAVMSGMTNYSGKEVFFTISLPQLYPLPYYQELFAYLEKNKDGWMNGYTLSDWQQGVLEGKEKTKILQQPLQQLLQQEKSTKKYPYTRLKNLLIKIFVQDESTKEKVKEKKKQLRAPFSSLQKAMKRIYHASMKLDYRNQEFVQTYCPMMTGISIGTNDVTWQRSYYWHGEHSGGTSHAFFNGTPMREVSLEGLDCAEERKQFVKDILIPFMQFEHIKMGENTVWPMPYKYLREYIHIYEREDEVNGLRYRREKKLHKQ